MHLPHAGRAFPVPGRGLYPSFERRIQLPLQEQTVGSSTSCFTIGANGLTTSQERFESCVVGDPTVDSREGAESSFHAKDTPRFSGVTAAHLGERWTLSTLTRRRGSNQRDALNPTGRRIPPGPRQGSESKSRERWRTRF